MAGGDIQLELPTVLPEAAPPARPAGARQKRELGVKEPATSPRDQELLPETEVPPEPELSAEAEPPEPEAEWVQEAEWEPEQAAPVPVSTEDLTQSLPE